MTAFSLLFDISFILYILIIYIFVKTEIKI